MGDSKQHENRLLSHDVRVQLRNEQIERMTAEIRKIYSQKLKAARTRDEKLAIRNDMKAEIKRRTEALRREYGLDTPDCI